MKIKFGSSLTRPVSDPCAGPILPAIETDPAGVTGCVGVRHEKRNLCYHLNNRVFCFFSVLLNLSCRCYKSKFYARVRVWRRRAKLRFNFSRVTVLNHWRPDGVSSGMNGDSIVHQVLGFDLEAKRAFI